MTELQTALVHYAIELANDNRYHYYYYYQGDSNLGPYGFDCATFNSFTFYKAMGWNDFPNPAHGGIGYFWPHIRDEHLTPGSFDFLIETGWTKLPYSDDLLTEGAIIVCDERLGHSLMYLGVVNGIVSLADANDFGGTEFGDNSIAVRPFPYYDPDNFYYIFIPPDVPVPPVPGEDDNFFFWYRYMTRRRRKHQ